MTVRITNIRLAQNGSLHEHIIAYRWQNTADGSWGTNDKPAMVDWIDNKKGQAVVGEGVNQVSVGTVHKTGVQPYLQTYADGKWTNNLLSLPPF